MQANDLIEKLKRASIHNAEMQVVMDMDKAGYFNIDEVEEAKDEDGNNVINLRHND